MIIDISVCNLLQIFYDKTRWEKLIVGNAVLWLIAILAHPVAQIIPTGSGETPKIFSPLIPLVFLLLGAASTSFLRAALRNAA